MWKYNVTRTAGELYHYASPYYDPVKAHEYYMRTRVLKGRRSTAGLNEEGRVAAKIIKENLGVEKKEKSKSLRSKATEKANTQSSAIQERIATIRAKFKGMSKEERTQNRESARREIAEMRNEIKLERESIFRQLGIDIAGLNKEYDKKYYDELDKLRSRYSKSTRVTDKSIAPTENEESGSIGVKKEKKQKKEHSANLGDHKKMATTK